jgi:hypothetical protein
MRILSAQQPRPLLYVPLLTTKTLTGTCAEILPLPLDNIRESEHGNVVQVRSFGPDSGSHCEIFKGDYCQAETSVGSIRNPADAPSLGGVYSFYCYIISYGHEGGKAEADDNGFARGKVGPGGVFQGVVKSLVSGPDALIG